MRSVRYFSFKNHCKVFVINKLYMNLKLKCVIWVQLTKINSNFGIALNIA